MMELTYIYALRDPRPSSRKAYVGKANDPFARLHGRDGHLKDKEVNYRTSWIKGLKALGLEPILEVLDEVPVSEWQFWEREWIRLYRVLMFDLVNGTDGGDGVVGYRLTPENRAKNRAAKLGKKHSAERVEINRAAQLRRRPTSAEAIESNRAARTGEKNHMFGKAHTEAAIEKNRLAHTGKKYSAEARANMSAARTGKKRGPYKKALA